MLFFWRLPALPFTVVQSLFEPSTHCAFQYIYNIRYLQNYYMRQTHRVREAAPQSKIPSIREGFFRTFYYVAGLSSLSTRSRSSMVSKTVSCHFT
jgi:hypothetical protein